MTFTVTGMGQYQPTRMPQGRRISSFTMTELMHIVLGAIPPPSPERSLIYGGEQPDVQHAMAYMDDGFAALSSGVPDDQVFERGFVFLKDHLFPRLMWAQMKLGHDTKVTRNDRCRSLRDLALSMLLQAASGWNQIRH